MQEWRFNMAPSWSSLTFPKLWESCSNLCSKSRRSNSLTIRGQRSAPPLLRWPHCSKNVGASFGIRLWPCVENQLLIKKKKNSQILFEAKTVWFYTSEDCRDLILLNFRLIDLREMCVFIVELWHKCKFICLKQDWSISLNFIELQQIEDWRFTVKEQKCFLGLLWFGNSARIMASERKTFSPWKMLINFLL